MNFISIATRVLNAVARASEKAADREQANCEASLRLAGLAIENANEARRKAGQGRALAASIKGIVTPPAAPEEA